MWEFFGKVLDALSAWCKRDATTKLIEKAGLKADLLKKIQDLKIYAGPLEASIGEDINTIAGSNAVSLAEWNEHTDTLFANLAHAQLALVHALAMLEHFTPDDDWLRMWSASEQAYFLMIVVMMQIRKMPFSNDPFLFFDLKQIENTLKLNPTTYGGQMLQYFLDMKTSGQKSLDYIKAHRGK